MRLKSWIKNLFIFIPLFFSVELVDIDKLLITTIAFVSFCLVSSAVYIFNDICDADKDAMHPVKQTRPIASGAITVRKAAVFSAILTMIGIILSFSINILTGLFIIGYLTLNMAYSLWLKRKPIFDCFCIAGCFVLRIYTGGVASGVPVSDWLFLAIVSMSLFMAFGKRRGELLKVCDNSTREVLQWYDLSFLRGMVFVCAGLSIVFYSLWAMYRGSNMIYTVPLIVFIIAKYLLLIHGNNSHGDPTMVIFENKSLFAACGLYGLLTIALLYYNNG